MRLSAKYSSDLSKRTSYARRKFLKDKEKYKVDGSKLDKYLNAKKTEEYRNKIKKDFPEIHKYEKYQKFSKEIAEVEDNELLNKNYLKAMKKLKQNPTTSYCHEIYLHNLLAYDELNIDIIKEFFDKYFEIISHSNEKLIWDLKYQNFPNALSMLFEKISMKRPYSKQVLCYLLCVPSIINDKIFLEKTTAYINKSFNKKEFIEFLALAEQNLLFYAIDMQEIMPQLLNFIVKMLDHYKIYPNEILFKEMNPLHFCAFINKSESFKELIKLETFKFNKFDLSPISHLNISDYAILGNSKEFIDNFLTNSNKLKDSWRKNENFNLNENSTKKPLFPSTGSNL